MDANRETIGAIAIPIIKNVLNVFHLQPGPVVEMNQVREDLLGHYLVNETKRFINNIVFDYRN
jgi:hypothetical protein